MEQKVAELKATVMASAGNTVNGGGIGGGSSSSRSTTETAASTSQSSRCSYQHGGLPGAWVLDWDASGLSNHKISSSSSNGLCNPCTVTPRDEATQRSPAAAAGPASGPVSGAAAGATGDASERQGLAGAIWEEGTCRLLEDMLQLLGAAALTLSDGLIDRWVGWGWGWAGGGGGNVAGFPVGLGLPGVLARDTLPLLGAAPLAVSAGLIAGWVGDRVGVGEGVWVALEWAWGCIGWCRSC